MDDAMSEDSDEEWEAADHSDGVSGRCSVVGVVVVVMVAIVVVVVLVVVLVLVLVAAHAFPAALHQLFMRSLFLQTNIVFSTPAKVSFPLAFGGCQITRKG